MLRRIRRSLARTFRPPYRRSPAPRRLGIETLENRNAPSGLSDLNSTAPPRPADPYAPATDSDTEDVSLAVLAEFYANSLAANAPPLIVGFSAREVGPYTYTFSGQVQDESPGECTVTLSGLPSVEGVTLDTEDDGTFEITRVLTANDRGILTAVATDAQGFVSEEAEVYVTPTPRGA